MKKQHLFITYLTLISLALLTSCTKDPSSANATEFDPPVQERDGNTHLVHEGESIQAAVDAANPGDVISILPGTYAEAITVNKPNLRMTGHGNGQVEIINPGGEEDGIFVTADGFELNDVVIKDFIENGIFLLGVDGFRLTKVVAINNGEYGIYPRNCKNGEVIDCEARGHYDAGIYVGLSENVVISQCRASGNVVGFEISNSTGITVTYNESHHNTNGFLVILLPFRPVKTNKEIEIHHNVVHHNNLPNFAPPSELVAVLPSGTGILIIGTDQAVATNNNVNHNNFIGIGVVSTLVIGALAGIPPEVILADIDPDPDGVEVRNNTVKKNGTEPSPINGFPAVDLLWDFSGSDNCWSNNTFDTSFPNPLPACN
jgi:parallel beta-helix repeat protein